MFRAVLGAKLAEDPDFKPSTLVLSSAEIRSTYSKEIKKLVEGDKVYATVPKMGQEELKHAANNMKTAIVTTYNNCAKKHKFFRHGQWHQGDMSRVAPIHRSSPHLKSGQQDDMSSKVLRRVFKPDGRPDHIIPLGIAHAVEKFSVDQEQEVDG